MVSKPIPLSNLHISILHHLACLTLLHLFLFFFLNIKFSKPLFAFFIFPELPIHFFLSSFYPNIIFPFSLLVATPCYPFLQVHKPLYDFSLCLSPSASQLCFGLHSLSTSLGFLPLFKPVAPESPSVPLCLYYFAVFTFLHALLSPKTQSFPSFSIIFLHATKFLLLHHPAKQPGHKLFLE